MTGIHLLTSRGTFMFNENADIRCQAPEHK
jgi:hypothetical protein